MTKTNWISGIIVVALVGTGFASTAMAHDKAKGAERRAAMFAELDTDSDGKVTLAELNAQTAARFAKADTDGNGMLSEAELAAMGSDRAAKRAGKMVKRMDANDDGALSLEEMQARRDPAKMFERLDANDDGGVTAEEFAEARGKFGRKGGGHGKRGD